MDGPKRFALLSGPVNSDLPMLWREQQNATFPYAARDLNVEGTTLLQLDVILGRILTQ